MEDSPTRFGSDAHMAPSTQTREMRLRLLNRYSGGFCGFKDLEARMAAEAEEERREEGHEKRRMENQKLARGEEVDLSERSAESLGEDQLDTIRDVLGSLGAEKTETRTNQE